MTTNWLPNVLVKTTSSHSWWLELVKWNSHFYFSIFKELYLIAQLKGQFLKLMGEHWPHPRSEENFLGSPRVLATHSLLWGQREICWKERSLRLGDTVTLSTGRRHSERLFSIAPQSVCTENPRDMRVWEGSTEEWWPDPALSSVPSPSGRFSHG